MSKKDFYKKVNELSLEILSNDNLIEKEKLVRKLEILWHNYQTLKK